MIGEIIYWLCNGLCFIVFFSIGMVSLHRDKPMWFWAGSEDKIEQETFTDVKAYNHKVGMMWIIYASVFLIVCIVGMFVSKVVLLFLYLIATMGGLIVMMLYYSHIHDRYTK